MQTLEQMS